MFEYRVVMPDGEDHLFCSWRCVADYAHFAALDDLWLAEDVKRHIESLPPYKRSRCGG